MRRIAVALWCLLAVPAHAAEGCRLVAEDGSFLIYTPTQFHFTRPDGSVTHCRTHTGGTGVAVRGVDCGDGYRGWIFYAASELGGDKYLLIFHDAAWYPEGCDD